MHTRVKLPSSFSISSQLKTQHMNSLSLGSETLKTMSLRPHQVDESTDDENDTLLPPQALPVELNDFCFHPEFDTDNIDDALAYLNSVQQEAKRIPDVVTANISQISQQRSRLGKLNSEWGLCVPTEFEGEAEAESSNAADCCVDGSTANINDSPVNSFENVSDSELTNYVDATSKYVEEIKFRQLHSSKYTTFITAPDEEWTKNALLRFRQLKSTCATELKADSVFVAYSKWSSARWIDYCSSNTPSTCVLSSLNSVQIYTLLGILVSSVEKGEFGDTTEHMIWLFALLAYLDDLQSFDGGVAWSLQRLRRYLERKRFSLGEISDKNYLISVTLIIVIIQFHFNQR